MCYSSLCMSERFSENRAMTIWAGSPNSETLWKLVAKSGLLCIFTLKKWSFRDFIEGRAVEKATEVVWR